MYKQSELDAELQAAVRRLRQLDIPVSQSICPRIELLNVHSFYGLCTPRGARKSIDNDYDFTICLSKPWLDGNPQRKGVLNTIYHELLHTCADTRGHDAKWKEYAARVNAATGLDIRRCGGDKTYEDSMRLREGIKHRDKRFRYIVECPECGAWWKYFIAGRVVKNADRSLCGYCRHKGLTVSRLPSNGTEKPKNT